MYEFKQQLYVKKDSRYTKLTIYKTAVRQSLNAAESWTIDRREKSSTQYQMWEGYRNAI